ncbi:hypothetical protein N473_26225 [Pseudoalteromonas luteoviolacea CPMOR-1]|uniref:Uncharacterized protein n=1 Tax=Pseudoalteromonas luteoviolacea CPMOR-1 TaxID=1365248 RepID=A0A161XYD2_9GAMM|nr:hypothetical protein [Pseudoalteromonas luteoviolacea]KZN58916.1 hypothetical protein N473_26225 [Pseudoalteromonas luteoviolacea CPMOR-1]
MSGFYYNGFDIHQMLIYLGEYCETLKIEKAGDSWVVYTNSEEHGEFEFNGSLCRGIMFAFRPFLQRAELERKTNLDKLALIKVR